jgi:hypothetical protein
VALTLWWSTRAKAGSKRILQRSQKESDPNDRREALLLAATAGLSFATLNSAGDVQSVQDKLDGDVEAGHPLRTRFSEEVRQ